MPFKYEIMSIDNYDYDYDYDMSILTKELEIINKKIELIQIVMYYSRSEVYMDLLNQELYYYMTWRDMILGSLGDESY